MARKSNKTSHVLNLLAGGDSNSDETNSVVPTSKSAPEKSEISIVDTTGTADPVADIIKQNLIDDEDPIVEPQVVVGAVTAKTDAVVEREIVIDIAADPPYDYVNVMEHIVRERVLYFMGKFDMCTCDRCVTDVMACALTLLPAKYIVADPNTVSPLLNFYGDKFLGIITVELTKACMIVKEHPHHSK